MSTTTFEDGRTPIIAAWLNDVDSSAYSGKLDDGTLNSAIDKYKQGSTGSVERTVASKLQEVVSVKDFGAVGDGVTDDSSAIQSAINAITTGQIFFPAGRYIIGTSLSINKPGITLQGAAPAGQGSVTGGAISELVASGVTHLIRYGDPAESSADGSHIYPGGAIRNLAFTGSISTTSGIRIYNVSVDIDNCYISNVVNATTGYGIWMKKAWLSRVRNTVIQSNKTTDLELVSACNNVIVDSCAFLSGADDGIHVADGGHNSITIINCDFEGKRYGIYLDTTSATLENIVITGCNFESNTTYGILSGTSQPILGLNITGTRHSSSGDGVYVNKVKGGFITGLDLNNCSCTFAQALVDSNVLLGPCSLTGTASIAGLGFKQPWTNGGLYVEDSASGALSQILDLSAYNSMLLVATGAATSATITVSNSNLLRRMSELQISIGHDNGLATVGGLVTLAGATFKTTATLTIPTNGKRTTVRFIKDANGIWWETSRATNAG